VVVSADTDFGGILARTGKGAPSVMLFRTVGQRRAWSQAALILANLPQVEEDLEAGACRSFRSEWVRPPRIPRGSDENGRSWRTSAVSRNRP